MNLSILAQMQLKSVNKRNHALRCFGPRKLGQAECRILAMAFRRINSALKKKCSVIQRLVLEHGATEKIERSKAGSLMMRFWCGMSARARMGRRDMV
jgi:hypothetical protein